MKRKQEEEAARERARREEAERAERERAAAQAAAEQPSTDKPDAGATALEERPGMLKLITYFFIIYRYLKNFVFYFGFLLNCYLNVAQVKHFLLIKIIWLQIKFCCSKQRITEYIFSESLCDNNNNNKVFFSDFICIHK